MLNQRNLVSLEERSDIRKKIEDVRITYQYDAKKNLYEKFEPLLFQFSESCDSAMLQILCLAENARKGKLGLRISGSVRATSKAFTE